jgi:hypothetical protein
LKKQNNTQFGSPNVENEEQSIAFKTVSLKTPQHIVNAFGSFEWVTKKRWPHLQLKEFKM